jgi:hypothetical protein
MFGQIHAVNFERVGSVQGRCGIVAGFKYAEYIADLELTARRVLANKPVELAVFRVHYPLGYEWREALPVINRRLRLIPPLDRGNFFHAAYRLQQLLGREFVMMRPCRFYPNRDSFSGHALPPRAFSIGRHQKSQFACATTTSTRDPICSGSD